MPNEIFREKFVLIFGLKIRKKQRMICVGNGPVMAGLTPQREPEILAGMP